MRSALFALVLVTACDGDPVGGDGSVPSEDARARDARAGSDAAVPIEIDPASIARVCALAASCGGPLSEIAPQLCYESVANSAMRGQAPDPIRCAGARTCAEYLECAARGYDSAFCGANPRGACDGEVAVLCTDPRAATSVVDCGASGLRCELPDGFGAPFCTDDVVCGAPPASGYRFECTGSSVALCAMEASLRRVSGCESGTTCAILDETATSAACLPTDRVACTDVGAVRCEGDTIVTCTAAGESRVDCGVVSRTCLPAGPTRAVCEGMPCINRMEPWTCDGSALVATCTDAGSLRFECTDLGLTSCTVPPGGSPRCS
jgi:hypothetical protein